MFLASGKYSSDFKALINPYSGPSYQRRIVLLLFHWSWKRNGNEYLLHLISVFQIADTQIIEKSICYVLGMGKIGTWYGRNMLKGDIWKQPEFVLSRNLVEKVIINLFLKNGNCKYQVNDKELTDFSLSIFFTAILR